MLTDPTFQDAPQWTSADAWVADDSPGLAYAPTPSPAVRVGLQVAAGESLHVTFREAPNADDFMIWKSLLDISSSGLRLIAGDTRVDLPVAPGTYEIEIWADSEVKDVQRFSVDSARDDLETAVRGWAHLSRILRMFVDSQPKLGAS